MKKIMIALMCLAVSGVFGELCARELSWESDLNKARSIAQEQKKKTILLFFTAPGWCGPCRRLESETIPSAGFAKVAKKAVLVKMDFSDRTKVTPEMNQAAKDFRLRGYPSLIVLSADGKEKGRIVGYKPAKDYLKTLKKLIEAK